MPSPTPTNKIAERNVTTVYEAHFGFRLTPFGSNLLPDQLYPSTALGQLSERLHYTIERAQIMMLTGEAGVGKSTALRALTAAAPVALFQFIYLPNPPLSPRALYQGILQELQMEPAYSTHQACRQVRETFCSLRRDGQTPVLLLEEAHKLPPTMLEEMRMLTNFQMDAQAMFALIFCGLPKLNRIMASRDLDGLAQRITVRHHLVGMEHEETKAYVTHHLKIAGVDRPLIVDEALDLLFEHAHGLPRKVNRIAQKSFEIAWRQGHDLVELRTMEMATANIT